VRKGVVEGYVEHVSGAEQLVESDADEDRALADSVSRQDDADVAGAEPSVETLLQQPERAPGIQELSIQRGTSWY